MVVNASGGSTVNLPAFIKSNISESVSIGLTCSTVQRDLIPGAGDSKTDVAAVKSFLERYKADMKERMECIFEGKKDPKNKILLKKVFTQLYIIEGEFSDVNKEHEILRMDEDFRMQRTQEKPITCNQIFSSPSESGDQENRVVLTKGIAGIGKTVSVQKFILDWAEEDANRHIDLMFLLPFREINLIRDEQYSLYEFLQEFYPQLDKVKSTYMFENLKLAFILDGLDESRHPLEFNKTLVKNIQKKVSVNALLTNLISGNLLPSAIIWITSRPATANEIPPECVSLFTEVRGFTDSQKEEYFRKRIPDEAKALEIIAHVKSSRSLHIMCHIPIFCWMTSTVLQAILLQDKTPEVPTTLTEMYIHFLILQMRIKNQKYDGKVERDVKKLLELNREAILKLSKLAFEQLKKHNIMFYEEDLRECGIDMSEESEYTGLCAEIFKNEAIIHEKKVYCFIHLSIQEFLAALHIFHSFLTKDLEELQFFCNDYPLIEHTLEKFLRKVVDKAKASDGGHLDLFLRFLLGISRESNQRLLQGLLTHIEVTKKSISKVVQYIKHVQNNPPDLSDETAINHLFCLMELKDTSLFSQIKKYLNNENSKGRGPTGSNCTALAYILLMSGEILDELDPKKYNPSPSACRRFVKAVRCCRRAIFTDCELTEVCWESIASVLHLENGVLIELDLSDNYGMEKGAKLLSDGLRSPHCKLEMLRLQRCHFSQSSCAELVLALTCISSRLRELDLSGNNLQDSGVEALFQGTSYPHLQILKLSWCCLTERSCPLVFTLIDLKALDLSNNDLLDSGVKILAEIIRIQTCKLQILRLSGCSVTQDGFSSLTSALKSNSLSHLRELDLSYNHPGDSEERLLTELHQNPESKLETLQVNPSGMQFIKAGIQKYAVELTLDPNTINSRLLLSDSGQTVSSVKEAQNYPAHPERFEAYAQVLSAETLNQCCYWEVELKGPSVDVGVAYPEIQRAEDKDITYISAMGKLGFNTVSWILSVENKRLNFMHNGVSIYLRDLKADRIGLYLDWPNGTLSFYGVPESEHRRTHLHTYIERFRKPLHAAFAAENGSITFCQLQQ